MSSKVEIVKEFTDIINACEGKVLFLTEQGDRLVADSMLSALVGFATILSVAEAINITFQCEIPADYQKIQAFMEAHKLGPFREKQQPSAGQVPVA